MKKIIIITILLIVITVGYNYIDSYTIIDKVENIEEALHIWSNRGDPFEMNPKPDIKKMLDIGKMKVVLYERNNIMGNAVLIRGLNGKYKIQTTGWGGPPYDSRVRMINNKKYLIIFSRKFGLNVTSVKVHVQPEEYIELSVPDEEYFIISEPIYSTKEPGHTILSLSYFDSQEDITDEVYDKYREYVKKRK